MRLLQPQGKCYKGTKDKQEQLHIWIFFSNNFGPPVLFPIFNMRPVAYLLPRQFPFETKDGEEPCVFSESQSAINLAGSSLFSSSKVIVTEKGISASGNRIFYSKTGGEFNCSVVHTKTDGAVWYLANSHFFRMCFLTPFYISAHQLDKSDKTVARSSLTLVCKLKIDWKTWPRISSQAYSHIYKKWKEKGTF